MAPPEGQKPQDDLTVAPAPAGATAFASADPDLTVPVAPDLTDRGARTTEPPGRRISLAAWLIGRGWTVTALALDAAMLLLGMAAAFVGARAADVDAHGSVLEWLFPPIVLSL